ncbi:hypothetical protein Bbelb_336950 [Branchiostoma belcheri]|nr:hypothetical protein Bbelb_336950 [Branchiostoma belcheri]
MSPVPDGQFRERTYTRLSEKKISGKCLHLVSIERRYWVVRNKILEGLLPKRRHRVVRNNILEGLHDVSNRRRQHLAERNASNLQEGLSTSRRGQGDEANDTKSVEQSTGSTYTTSRRRDSTGSCMRNKFSGSSYTTTSRQRDDSFPTYVRIIPTGVRQRMMLQDHSWSCYTVAAAYLSHLLYTTEFHTKSLREGEVASSRATNNSDRVTTKRMLQEHSWSCYTAAAAYLARFLYTEFHTKSPISEKKQCLLLALRIIPTGVRRRKVVGPVTPQQRYLARFFTPSSTPSLGEGAVGSVTPEQRRIYHVFFTPSLPEKDPCLLLALRIIPTGRWPVYRPGAPTWREPTRGRQQNMPACPAVHPLYLSLLYCSTAAAAGERARCGQGWNRRRVERKSFGRSGDSRRRLDHTRTVGLGGDSGSGSHMHDETRRSWHCWGKGAVRTGVEPPEGEAKVLREVGGLPPQARSHSHGGTSGRSWNWITCARRDYRRSRDRIFACVI